MHLVRFEVLFFLFRIGGFRMQHIRETVIGIIEKRRQRLRMEGQDEE